MQMIPKRGRGIVEHEILEVMLAMQYLLALLFYVVFSSFLCIGIPITGRFIPSRTLAYVTAKLIGLIVFGYAIWFFASIHVLDYQMAWAVRLLLLIAVGIGLFYSRIFFTTNQPTITPKGADTENDNSVGTYGWRSYKKILCIEVLSISLYFAYLFVRSYNASISGTEQFMDMMLLNAAGHTHYFPFIDSWYAGKTVNYYYYGSYLMSLLSNIAHIPYALSYTFSLGLLYCQSAVLSAALIFTMTRSRLFAALGAFFVTTAGTIFFAACTLVATLAGTVYSYASSTRLYTPSYIINEIPSYSFTVGDLHAHLLGLPFFLLTLAILYAILERRRLTIWLFVLLGLTLATSGMINMWDLVTLTCLACILAIFKIYRLQRDAAHYSHAARWLLYAVVTVPVTVILMAPLLLHFHNPTLGMGFDASFVATSNLHNVQYPTPLAAELGMWGIFGLSIVLALIFARRELRQHVFILVLGIVSLGILIGVELFFVRDIYSVTNPPYFRANTTFKFGYHAWTMLSIIYATMMYALVHNKKAYVRWVAIMVVCISIALGLVYPYQAFKQFYSVDESPQNLDGSVWMQGHSAEDLATIHFINDTFGDRAVIAEAVGDSYTWYGRISTFTGMISPMGWKSHEWTWRFDGTATKGVPLGTTVETGWGAISVVAQDIQLLYETSNTQEAEQIIQKYGIQFIYVGDMERTMYPNLQEMKFAQLGTIVFQTNDSRLYKIK